MSMKPAQTPSRTSEMNNAAKEPASAGPSRAAPIDCACSHPGPGSSTKHHARDGGSDHGAHRERKQRVADLAVRQMKMLFERRKPRGPAAHDRAEREERDGDRAAVSAH